MLVICTVHTSANVNNVQSSATFTCVTKTSIAGQDVTSFERCCNYEYRVSGLRRVKELKKHVLLALFGLSSIALFLVTSEANSICPLQITALRMIFTADCSPLLLGLASRHCIAVEAQVDNTELLASAVSNVEMLL
jgi:fucose permease